MNPFTLAIFTLGLAATNALPVAQEPKVKKGVTLIKAKPGVKHALDEVNNKFELLSPETNLVEPEFVGDLPAFLASSSDSLLPPPPPILEEDTYDFPEEADYFPEREGFITGHRIPIELFSEETQARIRANTAAKEAHILKTSEKGYKYVNSAHFRGRGTTTTTVATPTAPVKVTTEPIKEKEELKVVSPATEMAPPTSEAEFPAPPQKMFPPQAAFVEESIGGSDFLNGEGDPTYLRTLSSFF